MLYQPNARRISVGIFNKSALQNQEFFGIVWWLEEHASQVLSMDVTKIEDKVLGLCGCLVSTRNISDNIKEIYYRLPGFIPTEFLHYNVGIQNT